MSKETPPLPAEGRLVSSQLPASLEEQIPWIDESEDLVNLHGRLAELTYVIYRELIKRINPNIVINLSFADLEKEIEGFIKHYISTERIYVNLQEQKDIAVSITHNIIGFGPIEPLLADDLITDIMINDYQTIYVERKGRIQRSHIKFRDQEHVLQLAQRIANRSGRHVDESQPMVDSRLPNGSRVNIIINPVSIQGPVISIRKFSNKTISLNSMVQQENMSQAIADFLQISATCRLNILVSGGTGSGKTTLLNAISQLVNPNERIITIEDSVELRLEQPHVIRLEARLPNVEGEGAVTIRDLVKNVLRMRPDRIIVGEVRGAESADMLQAMNTGHDGSMSTIHANRAEEALWRLENMIIMSTPNMPSKAIRAQIVGGIDLIVQVERMRDGIRRVKEIIEVRALENDTIVTHSLFIFEYKGEKDGIIQGEFVPQKAIPSFVSKVKFYGLEKDLISLLGARVD